MFVGMPGPLSWNAMRHTPPLVPTDTRITPCPSIACAVHEQVLDLRAIQLVLGHADLKTTQRYLNVTDEELRRTMHEKLWSPRAAEK